MKIRPETEIYHSSGMARINGLVIHRSNNLGQHHQVVKAGNTFFNLPTRHGKQALFVDLNNSYFELETTCVINSAGVFLVVLGEFLLYRQERGLFLTSVQRDIIRKFDEPEGLRLQGACHRVINGDRDLFSLIATPIPAAILS